ncbi:MAG: nitroreductase family protein [Methanosarcinales archaeon]
MEILEIIKNRRSIRRFKKEDLPDNAITRILEAASDLDPSRRLGFKSMGPLCRKHATLGIYHSKR